MVKLGRIDGTYEEIVSYNFLAGRYQDVRADCPNAAGDGSVYMTWRDGQYVSVVREEW